MEDRAREGRVYGLEEGLRVLEKTKETEREHRRLWMEVWNGRVGRGRWLNLFVGTRAERGRDQSVEEFARETCG